MSPHHHPSDALLVAHAAGSLGRGAGLVVASHLLACSDCRATIVLAEAVGGALLDEMAAADMAPDALARALARIERPVRALAPPEVRPYPDWIEVPSEVLQAARRRRRWAAPGVWVATVAIGAERQRGYLLRVGAGMSVPLHTHRGEEMTCVLKGAFADRGEIFGPGDFAEAGEDIEHKPTVTADGECVCLIWSQAPLVPRDWVGRFFQPLVRI